MDGQCLVKCFETNKQSQEPDYFLFSQSKSGKSADRTRLRRAIISMETPASLSLAPSVHSCLVAAYCREQRLSRSAGKCRAALSGHAAERAVRRCHRKQHRRIRLQVLYRVRYANCPRPIATQALLLPCRQLIHSDQRPAASWRKSSPQTRGHCRPDARRHFAPPVHA